MGCDHDGAGLDGACEECLNSALAKEFELGRAAGLKQGYAAAVVVLKSRMGEAFMAHRDDEARVLRELASELERMSKERR